MEQLALAMWAPGARAECARAPPAARRPRDPGARAPMPAPAPAWCLPGSRGRAGSHGRVGRAGHAQGGQNPDQNPGPGARAPRWFLEGASTSTRENAVLSLDVAERRGALDRRARPAAAAPCRGPACHPGACLARCLRPRSARGARAPCSQRPSPHPGRRREAAPGRGRSARRARAARRRAALARRVAARAGRVRVRAGRRAQARQPGGRHEPLPPAAVLPGVPLRRAPALARRAAAPGPAPRPRARGPPPAPRRPPLRRRCRFRGPGSAAAAAACTPVCGRCAGRSMSLRSRRWHG